MYGALCAFSFYCISDTHGYGKLELRIAGTMPVLQQCFIYTNRVRYNYMGKPEASITANVQSSQINQNQSESKQNSTNPYSRHHIVSPSYTRTSSPSFTLTAGQLGPRLHCRGSRVPRTCAVARLCQHPHSRRTAESARCAGRPHASTPHRSNAADRP